MLFVPTGFVPVSLETVLLPLSGCTNGLDRTRVGGPDNRPANYATSLLPEVSRALMTRELRGLRRRRGEARATDPVTKAEGPAVR